MVFWLFVIYMDICFIHYLYGYILYMYTCIHTYTYTYLEWNMQDRLSCHTFYCFISGIYLILPERYIYISALHLLLQFFHYFRYEWCKKMLKILTISEVLNGNYNSANFYCVVSFFCGGYTELWRDTIKIQIATF